MENILKKRLMDQLEESKQLDKIINEETKEDIDLKVSFDFL